MHPRIKEKYVKKLLTKSLLYNLYIIKKLGIFSIAKKYDLSCDTIKKYLLLNNICLRQKTDLSLILTQKFLYKNYILLKKSSGIIAKDVGCNFSSVIRYLKHFNISLRSTSENRKLWNKAHPNAYKGKNNPMYNKIGKLNPAYKNGLPNCIDCGKLLCDYNSIRCVFHASINQTIHGLGYLPYSPAFSNKLKQEIRECDNFECQCCGLKEEEHKCKYNQKLQVHHIDYNKMNCDESNLITVCKKCNIQANYDRDYWYAFYMNKMEVK